MVWVIVVIAVVGLGAYLYSKRKVEAITKPEEVKDYMAEYLAMQEAIPTAMEEPIVEPSPEEPVVEPPPVTAPLTSPVNIALTKLPVGWVTHDPHVSTVTAATMGVEYNAWRYKNWDWQIRREGYGERRYGRLCDRPAIQRLSPYVGMVTTSYLPGNQRSTITYTSYDRYEDCWNFYQERQFLGLDDPETMAYFKSVMPSNCYYVMQFIGYLGAATSIKAMLNKLETEGVVDIIKVSESIEGGISWVRLKMLNASKFLDIVAGNSGWSVIKVYGPDKLV